MLWMNDQVECGALDNSAITVNTIKTGNRSVSDAALTCLDLKIYLLGKWLDEKDFPAFVKEKVRAIFDSHLSYRTMYNPYDGKVVDTTFIFSWPRCGTELIKLRENAIYIPGPTKNKKI